MIVSWNWLTDYVSLPMTPAEAVERLMMAGLNHESTSDLGGGEFKIDLEVTSNRPDCLGHYGIAREIGVLFDLPLAGLDPRPTEAGPAVSGLASVSITAPKLCPRYTARVVQGVTIRPSPAWLAARLTAIGQTPINNVVDITNYVLMEMGQPLHAFDLAKVAGRKIIVREAKPGEEFLAINHKTYRLESGMCVIADEKGPIALAGVMGGATSEVSPATKDLLIESADFEPLSIRSTARRLTLKSDSSYRFERGVDPEGIERASRRCCEMILELAGGTLAKGLIDAGSPAKPPRPIVLRYSQLRRVLGISIEPTLVRRILAALGNREQAADDKSVTCTPPSWRRDLEREIDLVEEVARIHGYDKIPEDASVPMAPSHRSDADRVLDKLRQVLAAAGFFEALTPSLTPVEWNGVFSPWTSEPPLATRTPMLQGADQLRRSLLPSLLSVRRTNEAAGNKTIELFETARVYLSQPGSRPVEELAVSLSSGGDFYALKGVLAAILAALDPRARLETTDFPDPFFEAGRGVAIRLGDEVIGYMGEVSQAARKQFSLRGKTTAAELRISPLIRAAKLIPQYREVSELPPIDLDLNLVTAESVRWADLSRTVQLAAGSLLESLQYKETYRDAQKDGPDKKRLIFSLTLRAADRTLTSGDAERVRQAVVEACRMQHGAALLG